MKARSRRFVKDSDTQNFWPSFTDMISTIALILFFLMILAYIQNIISGSNLEYAKKQVLDKEKMLEASNAEISRAERQLRLLEDKIDKARAEVKKGEIALKLSEEEVELQKEIIAESNKELGNLRSKLQGVAFLRVGVLKKVKASVENELGSTNDAGEQLVSIADNGNIVINEGLVFDYNSSTVKKEGKELLDNLAKAFENVLDDSSVRGNIDAISIQGHTDTESSAQYNRELSAKRATSVLNYIMSSNKNLENKYGRYFVASAYSEFRPISKGNSKEAHAKNRRIEISIILKDSNIQNIISEYLEDSMNVFKDIYENTDNN
ncbi:OmpA family protein [Abyssisolibacter fermentans]|uniref:OmpA family protein n=1 Tax=Abyssisolibacter fermentans TaxID=1766203 RepID=UPI00082D5D7C|nr:OmpA family protein [Abyssisolibacter fermentans]